MKNIFKKNQIIITALAILIAIAGYLNYSGTGLKTEDLAASGKDAGSGTAGQDAAGNAKGDTYGQVSDANNSTGNGPVLDADNVFTDTEDNGEQAGGLAGQPSEQAVLDTTGIVTKDGVVAGEAAQGQAGATGQSGAGAGAAQGQSAAAAQSTPGEAILANSSNNVNMIADMKLSREQVRAKNKATLMSVINNMELGDEMKQESLSQMIAMTDIAEREMAAEVLLEMKGFPNAVVVLSENSADVGISKAQISEAERAQIEDVVKRKTKVEAQNIVITPVGGN